MDKTPITKDLGEFSEGLPWSILYNYEFNRDPEIQPCHHCREYVDPVDKFVCPWVVKAKNEGGFNSTVLCLDCILEAISTKENATMRTYTKSLEWYGRVVKVTPGASQTMSKQPTKFGLGGYPACIERGRGSHVWDVDGNEYVDWICSLAAVTLGHAYRDVCLAVQDRLWEGTSFSLPHRLEGEVAERLCAIIPCAEMVRFVKTGSESTEAAIRVARAYTGRDVIVTVGAGYHCYDESTDILTDRGFIPIGKVRQGQYVATRNPKSGSFEYQSAEAIVDDVFFGEMVHISGVGVDLLVTPDHRMILTDGSECRAEDVQPGMRFPRTAGWGGIEEREIRIGHRTIRGKSRANRMKGLPTKGITSFPAKSFMRFLGWFVAEGWCQKARPGRHEVNIAQHPGELRQHIVSTIKQFGFRPYETANQIIFNSKELWHFLRQCGDGASGKRIPTRLKNLGPGLLSELLEGLIDGDGTRSGGRPAFYTTSKRLADDVQEIACKIGHATSRGEFENLGGPINGKTVKHRKRIIHIRFPMTNHAIVRQVSRTPFMGHVYCVKTKNGQVFVRRNGSSLWCGNSWHSWFAAVKPEHPGVPRDYVDLTRSFNYNDLVSLKDCFEVLPDPVAAVILEPTFLTPPAPGFLEGVRDLAHAHGALLIFDEVVTGFRWARAGGQEYFGVTPDLATFGKGMTGIGVPLACLVGRRGIMQHAILCSGTFGGDLLGLAACNAALDVYEREPVIEHLWKVGTTFRDGLQKLIEFHGLPARIIGYGVHPKLEWTLPKNQVDSADRGVQPPGTRLHYDEVNTLLMSLFLQKTAEGGVLIDPRGWNVSYSHSEQDVAESLAACDEAFRICAEGLSDGRIRERLRGEPIQTEFQVRS